MILVGFAGLMVCVLIVRDCVCGWWGLDALVTVVRDFGLRFGWFSGLVCKGLGFELGGCLLWVCFCWDLSFDAILRGDGPDFGLFVDITSVGFSCDCFGCWLTRWWFCGFIVCGLAYCWICLCRCWCGVVWVLLDCCGF